MFIVTKIVLDIDNCRRYPLNFYSLMKVSKL